MARRRRGHFKRAQPDRGWWVGDIEATFTVPGSFSCVNVVNLFDFEDITMDDLVTQDKSDWFIKRVILDAYPVITRVAPTAAPARIWGLALGTLQDDVALDWDLSALTSDMLFAPDSMDRWRRLFRAYNHPVYATAQPGFRAGGEIVTSANSVVTRDVCGEPWGLSAVHDDFEVSNAGLVPDSGVYAVIGTARGPGSYDWAENDILTVHVYARVLLQKRRA